jgi:hypothetical protein
MGASPVWAIGFAHEGSVNVINVTGFDLGEAGAYVKILWVVEPQYTRLVHLRGFELSDKAPLWFKFVGKEVTSAMLDPSRSRVQPAADNTEGFTFFPSYLVIPKAGCYLLEAQWDDGAWQIPFAAGA